MTQATWTPWTCRRTSPTRSRRACATSGRERRPAVALLRDALNDFATDWRSDLTPAWRTALAGASPDPLAVGGTLTYDDSQPIYPARRSKPLPEARADAHVFRAFDGLAPSKVRCVLIGQDPYPALHRATG